jgi:argininosuccinate lyase
MLPGIKINADAMQQAALQGYATATDLADYLVRKGLAFRDAHEAVGLAVRYALRRGCDLSQLSLAELRRFSPLIGTDVARVLTLSGSIAARNHIGGTAPRQVRAAIARGRSSLAAGTKTRRGNAPKRRR